MKLILVLLLVALGAVMWAGDRVTLEGERTVYTVRCDGGTFEGDACTGKLVAGDRYRFRALRKRNEVLYWIVGSNSPSGKYTDCAIENRGNWTCKVPRGQAPTITYEMVDDIPRPGTDPPTPPFRAVSKWKWHLLRLGVPLFHDADV